MDYGRIYNEFILDRREKEKSFSKDQYTELHHILPRCMNGGNEKENLIRLTPSDHFFAHLLLAKTYGGNNWLALHSMLNRGMRTEAISYKDFANKRKQFGFIRRLAAKGFSGRNNPAIDKNVYLLKNRDGAEVVGDRIEICKKTDLNSRSIGKLVNGKLKVIKGWYYPTLNPTGITDKEINRIEKENSLEVMTLYHFDGREWTGNKYSFYKEFGKQLNFQTEDGSCHGWFLNEDSAKKYLAIRSSSKKISRKLIPFENIKTKEISYHSKTSLSKFLGVSKEKVNDLILGKCSQLKGVRLASDFTKVSKKPNRTHYKFKFLDTGLICNLSIPEMAQKYNIPDARLYSLVKRKVKVIKKYGITLA